MKNKIRSILLKWLGVETKTMTAIRLTKGQYEILEARYQFNINDKTTDLQAAFGMGVNHVLREIRNGFVAE